MPKEKFITIQEAEEKMPQTPEKYRIYKLMDARDGRFIYNFSKFFKKDWYLTNAPILFKSDQEAKETGVMLLAGGSKKSTTDDIEIISLMDNE